MFENRSVRKILALGAHPDDIEIGCGGALAKLIQSADQPIEIFWVVFSGNEIRKAEARASAEQYLAGTQGTSRFLDFRDSFFPDQWATIKSTLHEIGNQFAPDLVFSHKLKDRHQDHIVLAELTWNVFRRQTIFEYEIPKYEGDLGDNNLYCSLTQEQAMSKVELLEKHFTTQAEKPWFDKELFMGLMRLRGSEATGPAKYAEAFTCRKLVF